MAKELPGPEGFADDVVPELAPAPIVTREFKPLGWYRPRKQYIRKYQWNHEIVQQVIRKRTGAADTSVLRVFGLPSAEYLDVMSMRGLCENHGQQVHYLGFNASYVPPKKPGKPSKKKAPVDLYSELQPQRMIEASSFIHPSSVLYPDRFELLRYPNSQCWIVLDRFANFDVINLDICGCIVDPNKNKATAALGAVAELLRWQSIRRLTPWLFFITTYCAAEDMNREACQILIDAVKQNADDSEEFRTAFEEKANIEVAEFHATFSDPDSELPPAKTFMRIFAVAMGKWLACRLQKPNPCSFVSMLPSFCFRHVDDDDSRPHDPNQDPRLLSLAYLIEPAPEPGESGISPQRRAQSQTANSERYTRHAKQILKTSFATKDLDLLISEDADKRREMVEETRELLVGCGFDAGEVKTYLAKHK
jgi:hypothetical protein